MGPVFALIAFNHEQIKASTTGGFVLSNKESFPDISRHLLNIDTSVLQDLANRMSNGEYVKPDSEAEKACFNIIGDLDYVQERSMDLVQVVNI